MVYNYFFSFLFSTTPSEKRNYAASHLHICQNNTLKHLLFFSDQENKRIAVQNNIIHSYIFFIQKNNRNNHIPRAVTNDKKWMLQI